MHGSVRRTSKLGWPSPRQQPPPHNSCNGDKPSHSGPGILGVLNDRSTDATKEGAIWSLRSDIARILCVTTRRSIAQTHDALKASFKRKDDFHEVHKSNSGTRMHHVRHGAGTGSEGNRPDVERPAKPAWERRSDDHSGLSAW